MKKLGTYSFFMLLVFSFIGLVYQSYSSHIDKGNYPPVGKLIDIGGYKLHAQELGEGDTTIIFDAGMGDSLLTWNRIVPEISKFAKVLTYDRAGLGWSDKSPLPRTSLNIVKELYTLLEVSKLNGPFILVGHSFGGLNMQLFAKKHPDIVAGLVLVDSVHESQVEKMPKSNTLRKVIFKVGMWAAPIGIPRLYLNLDNPEEQAVISTIKHQYTILAESSMFIESTRSLKETDQKIGNIPLIVIARNSSSAILEAEKNKSLRNIAWAKLQEDLAQRSMNSSLIFSESWQHTIHRNQPNIVIDAIKKMVEIVGNKGTDLFYEDKA